VKSQQNSISVTGQSGVSSEERPCDGINDDDVVRSSLLFMNFNDHNSKFPKEISILSETYK